MDRKDTNWDREQVAPDTDVTEEGEHKPTWNRHQWASDNAGTSGDTIGGTGTDDVLADEGVSRNDLDAESADMHSISGRGKPSGESHWERVEPSKDR